MNKYSGFPQPVPGGYRCMIRLCRDSRPSPVMGEGAKPKVFETKGEAWAEIATHLLNFMNGHVLRGETFDTTATLKEAKRAKADRLFRKGGGTINVERRELA